eukprot:800299-Alexandrium_andersonii.AAC.1
MDVPSAGSAVIALLGEHEACVHGRPRMACRKLSTASDCFKLLQIVELVANTSAQTSRPLLTAQN